MQTLSYTWPTLTLILRPTACHCRLFSAGRWLLCQCRFFGPGRLASDSDTSARTTPGRATGRSESAGISNREPESFWKAFFRRVSSGGGRGVRREGAAARQADELQSRRHAQQGG